MNKPYRILILGGYGVFGSQITANLSRENNLDILVSGRSSDKAQALCDDLGKNSKAKLIPLTLDITDSNFSSQIDSLNIDLLIHTCGPFQGQNYHVAKACINAGIHYLDLADGREFVCNIGNLDSEAKKNDCLIISGASSVPGLSSAVINNYKTEFSTLKQIECYILPGNQSEHGEATVASVLSYTGKPIRVWRNNRWSHNYGWQDTQRIALKNLGKRWAGNCDVPDLALFPKHYKTVQSVKFQAGSELSIMHISLWLLSWLSRFKLIKNWNTYAKSFTRICHWFLPFGSDTGGMHMKLVGQGIDSKHLEVNWQLIATHGDGSKIPAIPAIILAKKMAQGMLSQRGAMPCMELFSLKDFTPACENLHIQQNTTKSIDV